MNSLTKSIIVVFICFGFLPLFAQEKDDFNYDISQISQEQGFYQGTVNAILKDKAGFMWFGTPVGLVKYDGYNFINYISDENDSNTISDSFIQTLFEDKQGVIWIGGAINGLSSINPYTGEIKRYNIDEKHNNSDQNKIFSVAQDAKGRIWIGTSNGGIFYSNIQKNNFKKLKLSQINNNIKSILIDRNNIVCACTEENGFVYIDANANELDFKYKINPIKIGNSSNVFNMTSACFDSHQNIWMVDADNNAVVKKEANTNILTKYNTFSDNTQTNINFKIRTIFCDKADNVWIATSSEGVYLMRKKSNVFFKIKNATFFEKNSSCNNILSIAEDKLGTIWFGSLSCGLLKLDKKASLYKLYPTKNLSTGQNVIEGISCIFVDSESRVWKCVASSSVFVKDKKDNIFKIFKPKRDETNGKGLNEIFCMQEDNLHIYFGSSSGGISYYDKKKGVLKLIKKNGEMFFPPANTATKLNNKIIFGSWGQKIWYINANSETPEFINPTSEAFPASLTDGNVNYIAPYKNKYLLIGTEKGGLFVYDTNFKLLANISKSNFANSINNNYVVCIMVDKQNNVWLGTNGNGLNVIQNLEDFIEKRNKHLKIFYITKENQLPDNVVIGMMQDNANNYWISTYNKLGKIVFQNQFFSNTNHTLTNTEISKLISIKSISNEDGLPSNEFNTNGYAKLPSGEMFFGTQNGIFSFNPNISNLKSHQFPLVITKFKIFDKEFPLDSNITYKKQLHLSYKESFFSFEFAALNFQITNSNEYAYMMDGFDKDWIYSNNRRFASYTNLDAGDYVFRVKSSSNDGIWNKNEIALKISISPPWYKTKWAYLLFVVLFFTIVYSYIKWREIKLKQEKKILEDKVEERTAEIAIINKEITKKNVDITDSINYAKRIQQAILPPIHDLKENFNNSFILYKPKDIVSGDFYWLFKSEIDNNEKQILLAAADCTGHGVPGAFMSMISIDKLNEAAKYYADPSKILASLNMGIKLALRQSGELEGQTRDGLDIALVRIIKKNETNFDITFAGANRPLWLLKNNDNEIEEIKATKAAIGGFTQGTQEFAQTTFTLQKGDAIYLFSDGYPDQFGGDLNKKFMTKKLKETIINSRNLNMNEQCKYLENALTSWQRHYEQVDDVLVIGVKF